MEGRLTLLRQQLGPSVRLLAASKQQSRQAILEAHELGQMHFGENYAQELQSKAKDLPATIHWHFIGALQGNKLRGLLAIPNLWAIETLDTAKHATQIHAFCQELDRTVRVFIQVNTSGEQQKQGCNPTELPLLIAHVRTLPRLELLGLMTIGSLGTGERDFACLRSLRDQHLPGGELGMGMSGDWQLAVQMGATEVRLGTLLFGERPPK